MNRTNVISLFEHMRCPYDEISLTWNHPVVEEIANINETAKTEFIYLGRTYLKAKEYVGVIQIGDTTFQILPKIDSDPTGDSESPISTKAYEAAVDSATRNLLYFLSYTHNFPIREQEIASPSARRANLLCNLLNINTSFGNPMIY